MNFNLLIYLWKNYLSDCGGL